MKEYLNYKDQSGYIALASMLVILVIVLAIGISVSLLSISEVQTALGSKKSMESLYLVESCAQEALLRLRANADLPTQVALPQLTCNVTMNSQANNLWNLTVTGEFENYTRTLDIVASRDNQVLSSSWQEL